MSGIHFTSDTHFFHKKALTFREFATIEEMHERLVAEWNTYVKPKDTVYHLGDLTFGHWEPTSILIARLNGFIKLVPGNHDREQVLDKLVKQLEGQLEVLPPLVNVKCPVHRPDGGTDVHRLTLCHFPLLVWDRAHYGQIHLHGHSHGHCQYPARDNGTLPRMMDVGVDAVVGYRPLSLQSVLHAMNAPDRGYVKHDQH
jgi:calcineurin-like phosphoesterase family protein